LNTTYPRFRIAHPNRNGGMRWKVRDRGAGFLIGGHRARCRLAGVSDPLKL
jgi:hypothetical protein